MLATMRKAIQKGLLQVVIWVTVISMVFFFSGASLIDQIQRLFGIEDYILAVNKYRLTKKDYDHKKMELEQRIAGIRQQFGPYAQAYLQMYGLTGDLSNVIIKDAGLTFFANMITDKFNVQLDPKFITKAIAQQLPKEMLDEEGKINMEALQYLLNGMSIAQLEREIEGSLKKNLATQLIDSALFLPSFMVKSKYEEQNNLKKYAILTFPQAKYLEIAKKTVIADDELKSYYESHKNNYMVPEKRAVVVWKFAPGDYGTTVSERDIKGLYDKNKSNYIKEPAKIQIRRILLSTKSEAGDKTARQKAIQIKSDLLKEPAKFGEFAKQYSDDKNTAQKGGLLDFMKKEEFEPALGQAAFSLENDGQISDLITTEEGIEIIQRVARKPAVYKQLQEVTSELKNTLINTKFSASFNLDAKRVIKEAKKDISALNNFVEYKKAKQEINKIEKNNTQLSRVAFNLKDDGYAYFIENGVGYIVHLTKIENAYLPQLSNIVNKVKDDIYKEKAQKLIDEAIKKAKSEIDSVALKDLSSKFDAMLTVTSFINAESNQEISKLNNQGFPMNKLLAMSKRDAVKIFNNNDGYLVKLVEIKKAEESKTKLKSVEKDLYVELKDALDKGFIASLARTAKISINKDQLGHKRFK